MKSSGSGLRTLAMMAALASMTDTIGNDYRPTGPSFRSQRDPLTKKQKKSRKASKNAKKSRRNNR